MCASGLAVTIDDIPSVLDVTLLLTKAKKGKGQGEDALPAEVYTAGPPFFTQHVHPLYTKSFIRLEEPLSSK